MQRFSTYVVLDFSISLHMVVKLVIEKVLKPSTVFLSPVPGAAA